MYPEFFQQIKKMNETYELAVVGPSQQAMLSRLVQFDRILTKECQELHDIIMRLEESVVTYKDKTDDEEARLDARVMLADLLADIIVYCASEAERWQIRLSPSAMIVMASNFSKLDSNGKPIKDGDDKFLKGPNYWKPEPYLRQLLQNPESWVTTNSAGEVQIVSRDITNVEAKEKGETPLIINNIPNIQAINNPDN